MPYELPRLFVTRVRVVQAMQWTGNWQVMRDFVGPRMCELSDERYCFINSNDYLTRTPLTLGDWVVKEVGRDIAVMRSKEFYNVYERVILE